MGEAKRADQISPVLEIGLELSIKMRGDNYEATIRGWKPDAFILVDCHAVSSGALKIVPDTAVIIRLVNKGFVLSCSSTIMSVVKQPINLLVLEFPTRFEKMQVRKYPRLDVCLPALYNNLNAQTPEAKNFRHKATTMDISIGGALIASKEKLENSQKIALSVKLSATDKITNIESVVKNLPKQMMVGNDTYYMAGIAYDNLSEENKAKLVKFIEANWPFRS
jgi:c-di-GMP-binding flagellar brake protein YcgR